jgi:hypothetical protein
MAKRKVRPEMGALSKLLKEKGMTQTDAHAQTRVDRKTLLKIDRGEEVKRETLEQVANRLRTPLKRLTPETELRDDDHNDKSVNSFQIMGFNGTVTLSKINAERLSGLLIPASRIRWEINARFASTFEIRRLLRMFERAVVFLRRNLPKKRGDDDRTLRSKLERLSAVDDLDSILKQLAEHRLTILAAEYLFWEQSNELDRRGSLFEDRITAVYYTSSRIVLFSVKPRDTQSRRAWIDHGSLPPKFAHDRSMRILVDGLRLKTKEEYDAIGAAKEKPNAC